jgi:DNA-binding NarL/FixJ family response regulator
MDDIRVLIVDDHAVFRMGFASLLSAKKGFAVVGDAANGEEAIAMAAKLHPDVIVMDLIMPKMDGAETTKLIRERDPSAKILVLTSFGMAAGIAHALDAGALGAILKNAEYTEIVASIRKVASGIRAVSPEIERMLSNDPPPTELSSRQTEILTAITRGLSNSDIAAQLGISLDMVKEHTTALFAKIGAANRTQAAVIAMRKHLLKT